MDEEQVARLKPIIEELAPTLNAYLASIGPRRRDRDAVDEE